MVLEEVPGSQEVEDAMLCAHDGSLENGSHPLVADTAIPRGDCPIVYSIAGKLFMSPRKRHAFNMGPFYRKEGMTLKQILKRLIKTNGEMSFSEFYLPYCET